MARTPFTQKRWSLLSGASPFTLEAWRNVTGYRRFTLKAWDEFVVSAGGEDPPPEPYEGVLDLAPGAILALDQVAASSAKRGSSLYTLAKGGAVTGLTITDGGVGWAAGDEFVVGQQGNETATGTVLSVDTPSTEFEIEETSQAAFGGILAVDQGQQKFTVENDLTGSLLAGLPFRIGESTGNDGDYTVVSAVLDGSDTVVEVDEAIPDATVDGYAIAYPWVKVLGDHVSPLSAATNVRITGTASNDGDLEVLNVFSPAAILVGGNTYLYLDAFGQVADGPGGEFILLGAAVSVSLIEGGEGYFETANGDIYSTVGGGEATFEIAVSGASEQAFSINANGSNPTSSIAAYIDGAATKLKQWNDQSGSGLVLTPEDGNLPGSFDAALNVANGLPGFQADARLVSATNISPEISFPDGKISGFAVLMNVAEAQFFDSDNNGGGIVFSPGPQASPPFTESKAYFRDQSFGYNDAVYLVPTIYSDVLAIHECTFNSNNDGQSHYLINGQEDHVYYQENHAMDALATNFAGLLLQSNGPNKLCAVYIWPRLLTTLERAAVRAKLAADYGITLP